MAEPNSFVDNLKNLRLVMSVAFEHIQENRNQFVKDATGNQVRQVERSISQIRAFADRIETEFNTLEYLVSKRLPRSNAGFEVCGEAADGVEGIEQAKKLKPDLIVLDLAMPRMNGVEAASVLNQTMPTVPIVLLTLYQNLIGPSLASAVGVRAIIDKTDGMDKLVACVHLLLDGSTG